MDVLRRAVGDTKLTYLGFSYGTYLGNVYANMFPDRVRAMVIDGVHTSKRYAGGIALRFARVKRYRPDKDAAEADTLDDLRALLGP